MIRRLREEEWAEWRELRLRALADSPGAFGSTYEESLRLTDEQWRARGRRLALATDTAMFISDRQASFDGCAGLSIEPSGRGWLISMWVAPASRGRGVGTVLVAAVADQARRAGLDRLSLDVAVGNAPAIALYERCGFVATGIVRKMERDASILESEMTLPL